MQGDQILLFIAIVAFLGGASAILKTRTMQNTIDQQGTLIDTLEARIASEESEHAKTRSKNMELRGRLDQQQSQIDVLTNTVNSGDLIRALMTQLSNHHTEAMDGLGVIHGDMTNLRTDIAGVQRAVTNHD